MRARLLAPLMFLQLSATAAPDPEILSHCKKKWGADSRMVLHCHNEQVDAANDLAEIIKGLESQGLKPAESPTLGFCIDKWSDDSQLLKIDYKMVVYCIDEQLKARERLENL